MRFNSTSSRKETLDIFFSQEYIEFMIKNLDWYPIQTCPKCLKSYDPIENLLKCPDCNKKLIVIKPKVKKGVQL